MNVLVFNFIRKAGERRTDIDDLDKGIVHDIDLAFTIVNFAKRTGIE